MLESKKDNYDENLEDIFESINNILKKNKIVNEVEDDSEKNEN